MSRKEDALKRLACALGCVGSEADIDGNTVDEIVDCIVRHTPFGKQIKVIGDTLTYSKEFYYDCLASDCNITEIGARLSNNAPTIEELAEATLTVVSDAGSSEIPINVIASPDIPGCILLQDADENPWLIIVTVDGISLDGEMTLDKGVYFFMADDGTYYFTVPNFTFTQEVMKPIDTGFVPNDHIARFEWDGSGYRTSTSAVELVAMHKRGKTLRFVIDYDGGIISSQTYRVGESNGVATVSVLFPNLTGSATIITISDNGTDVPDWTTTNIT